MSKDKEDKKPSPFPLPPKMEVAKALADPKPPPMAVAHLTPPAPKDEHEVTFKVRVGYNGKKFEAGQKYVLTGAQLQALFPFVTRS